MSYYDVLGVNANATDAEIRQGYITQSLKYHPDRYSIL
jgi:curved DNA-binding protein CbpA